MVEDRTLPGRLFDAVNRAVLLLLALAAVFPFVYVAVHSFSDSEGLLPRGWTLDAYRYIFSTRTLPRALLVSVGITVVGTLLSLALTALTAYPLSRKALAGRRIALFLVLFTILFSGGMIPTYFVVKNVGLIDSYWALVVPGAISSFNLIVMKNFFQQLPEGLEEAAKIDGASEFGTFFRIVLPLSTPALATFALFYAVSNWNEYVDAVLYINSTAKWPIQVLMRNMIMMAGSSIGDSSELAGGLVPPKSIRMAVIVVSTIPILLVYPFLQKHFAQGLLLGSVKG
ncbi:carbohydrate ABC transporter permease [Paenibacillus hodogayensis]|uniref:Carbohydrate ABC transporter permease n=1 Tax=Paenibacillus hodogayensis TaxID=279208 RepID=A0ABV5VWJ0_9BACL